MELNNVTDLHNRRRNLVLVSRRAKAMGIPLLIWPEDKAIIKQTDLPVLDTIHYHVNRAPDWKTIYDVGSFLVRSDDELRDHIREGYAYAITDQDNVFDYVTEYEVRSRDVDSAIFVRARLPR